MKNKGFVLIETIISAVFVLGLFTFMATNIIPLIGEYDRDRNFDGADSIYAAHLIRKMILKSDTRKAENLVDLPENERYYLFEGNEICYYLSNYNYCNTLLSRSYLDVRKIVITDFKITDEFRAYAKGFDRQLSTYIKQMQSYNNTGKEGLYDFDRRIIVSFNDGRVTNIELQFDKGQTYDPTTPMTPPYVPSPSDGKYTVTYNSNGGTGDMSSQEKLEGVNITIKTNGFSKQDGQFKEWNTRSDGNGKIYYEGEQYSEDQDITLYAIWKTCSYKKSVIQTNELCNTNESGTCSSNGQGNTFCCNSTAECPNPGRKYITLCTYVCEE
jgi:hypothetical protein